MYTVSNLLLCKNSRWKTEKQIYNNNENKSLLLFSGVSLTIEKRKIFKKKNF